MVQMVNRFAYTYVAMYGMPFCKSARAVTALFARSRCKRLGYISDIVFILQLLYNITNKILIAIHLLASKFIHFTIHLVQLIHFLIIPSILLTPVVAAVIVDNLTHLVLVVGRFLGRNSGCFFKNIFFFQGLSFFGILAWVLGRYWVLGNFSFFGVRFWVMSWVLRLCVFSEGFFLFLALICWLPIELILGIVLFY